VRSATACAAGRHRGKCGALAVSFEKIEPHFVKVRSFVLNDLRRILRLRVGGNYAAGLIIVCACEEVARLWCDRREGELIFARMLPPKWYPVRKSLYKALRNGLAHFYETQAISLHESCIKLSISWREKPHLTFSDKGELYLNVRSMARELRKVFAAFESELRGDAALRDQFWTRSKQPLVIADVGATEACHFPRPWSTFSHNHDPGARGRVIA
jgi:hypothetical protein